MNTIYIFKTETCNCSLLPGIKPACFAQATRLMWHRLFSVKLELLVQS